MDQAADTSPQSASNNTDGDHDSGVDETTQGKDAPTTNGDLDSPNKSPSKIPAPKRLSMPSPTKSTKSSPKTPEAPSTAEKKKVPMNKVQVGAAPSPNLKTVRSKIGSLENTSYKPGGGKIKIENRKVDFSHAQPRIAAKNDTYSPGGGDKKITQVKLAWNAKSKIGSLDNAAHKPGGGDKKIESMKLDFKDKAKPKIGSKDNIKHQPGGGAVKIEEHRLEIKAESKVGSMDNVKHKPGGGEKKIFDDKEYIKQMSSVTSKAGSEGVASGTQIEDGYCSSNTSRKTSRDRRQTSETIGERQKTPTSLKTSPNEEIKHKSLIEKHIEKQKQIDSVENENKKLDTNEKEHKMNGIEHSTEEAKESIVENAIKEESETITESKEDNQIQTEAKVETSNETIGSENETVSGTKQKEENGLQKNEEESKNIQQKTDNGEYEKEQIETESLQCIIKNDQLTTDSQPENETSAIELYKENVLSAKEHEEQSIPVQQKNEQSVDEPKRVEVTQVKNNVIENKDMEKEIQNQKLSPVDHDVIEDGEEKDHNSNQTNGDGQPEEVDISKNEINLTDDDKKSSEETEFKNKEQSTNKDLEEINETKLENKEPKENIEVVKNDINEKDIQDIKLEKTVNSEPAEMTEIERIVLAVAAKLREDEVNERIQLEDIITVNTANIQVLEESNKCSVENANLKEKEEKQKSKENLEQETLNTNICNTDSTTENFNKITVNSNEEEFIGNIVTKSTKEQKAQEEKEIDSKENMTDEKKNDNQVVECGVVPDKGKQPTQFDTNIIKTLEVTAIENQKVDKVNTNVDLLDEKGKSNTETSSTVAASDNLTNSNTIPASQSTVPSSQDKTIELEV